MNARQTEIINLLLLSYVPIHLRQFEMQFGVSGRTIKNDITEINEILEENHFSRIHSDRRKGFSLSLDREEKSKLQEFIGLKLDEEYLTREERVFQPCQGRQRPPFQVDIQLAVDRKSVV